VCEHSFKDHRFAFFSKIGRRINDFVVWCFEQNTVGINFYHPEWLIATARVGLGDIGIASLIGGCLFTTQRNKLQKKEEPKQVNSFGKVEHDMDGFYSK